MNYFYILMAQKDLLENEVIEELLRERASAYLLQNKRNDFWVLLSPKFVKEEFFKSQILKTNFYQQKKNTIVVSENDLNPSEFYAAIVSSNKEFITWMSLRLGYFENINENKKSNEHSRYTSNGISGTLTDVKFSPLESNQNDLHPSILVKEFEKLLKVMTQLKINETWSKEW